MKGIPQPGSVAEELLSKGENCETPLRGLRLPGVLVYALRLAARWPVRGGARGLRKITLHATLSVQTFQATALARLRAGDPDRMRRMTVKVA